MNRILVWDIPTRLFHVLLAGSFVAAFAIANLVDDEGPVFVVHMLLGLTMLFMVVLRVVWGLVGTRYARFGSFLFGPGAVLEYVRGMASGQGRRHVGHNPGSSMAIYLILALTVGLAVTGVLQSSGGELAEEVHEVLAWTFAAVVGLHVAGVVWHMLRRRENIALSMVDGHKQGEPAMAIPSARPVVGLLFLLLVGGWSWLLVGSYDATTRQVTVPLVGQTLTLGEDEEEEGHERGGHEEHEDDDD